MLKKLIAGLVLVTSASFAMSLSEVNKASKEKLMEINGIGEVKAANIIKARKSSKFKSFEDLSTRAEGVGEQIVANIKSDVKVGEKAAKVTKSKTKTKSKSKTTKAKDAKKSADKKTTKAKSADKKKERKIKSMDDKKKELKTKTKSKSKKLKTKAKTSKKKLKSKK